MRANEVSFLIEDIPKAKKFGTCLLASVEKSDNTNQVIILLDASCELCRTRAHRELCIYLDGPASSRPEHKRAVWCLRRALPEKIEIVRIPLVCEIYQPLLQVSSVLRQRGIPT